MSRMGLALLALCLGLACTAPAAGGTASGGAAGPRAAPPAANAPPAAAAPAPSATNPYLPAPGEPPVPIRIGTSAVSGGFIHLYTALDTGLFEQYGFRAEQVVIPGSAPGLSALAGNETQFHYSAADGTIPGLASGVAVKIVANALLGLPYVLIGRPEVQTVPDLRGKTIGIARAGDLSDRLSRLTVERFGLRPNEDVQIRPIGGSQPERYRALVAGIIDAVAITPPLEVQGRKDGLNVVYTLADLNLPFLYSSVHTSDYMIREQPQLVQRFVAAMAEALHFTEKHPELARQAVGKALGLDDPEAIDSAYNAYAVRIINRRMLIPFDVVDEAIEFARQQGTQVTVRGAEDIATNQFVEDLERTGFLQQLWGPELPPR